MPLRFKMLAPWQRLALVFVILNSSFGLGEQPQQVSMDYARIYSFLHSVVNTFSEHRASSFETWSKEPEPWDYVLFADILAHNTSELNSMDPSIIQEHFLNDEEKKVYLLDLTKKYFSSYRLLFCLKINNRDSKITLANEYADKIGEHVKEVGINVFLNAPLGNIEFKDASKQKLHDILEKLKDDQKDEKRALISNKLSILSRLKNGIILKK